MAAAGAPFRGRTRERHQLDRLLDGVRGGRSAVLVIRGEPGIGKTALLHYCLRQAAGFRTARITGVESELELPFAALHQLCRPMLSNLSTLPEPQANALRVAFRLPAGSTPDRFVVGLAVLPLWARRRWSVRWSAWSTTRSGSTSPPPRCSGSWHDACWPSRF